MGRNLFSVPIFFIVFRETFEAAIIVSVLLGIIEQIAHPDHGRLSSTVVTEDLEEKTDEAGRNNIESVEMADYRTLTKKARIQVFLGAGLGFLGAVSIGAAFIAVWFTKATSLWSKSEELWEGIFELIASIIIFVMGVTMLKMDRAKAKWRIKLQHAFQGDRVDMRTKSGKWLFFILPFITVLREGLEAVIFVGGVSLGQPATSIPIATIVGLLCGLICGYLIYAFASRSTLTIFLVVMTNFILLIGAGLFSRACGAFGRHRFNALLGADRDDIASARNGPGSYDVRGNVWHLDCCNPESKIGSGGWTIFGAIFGWTNSATLGTILGYVFYWIAVIAVLIYMKFKEGRTKLVGRESAAGARRREARVASEKKEELPS